MPYITQEQRLELKNPARKIHSAGELNYCISGLIHEYLESHSLCYTYINEVIGVLECCKLEAYRQLAVPYEDQKKSMNGPVSNLDATT